MEILEQFVVIVPMAICLCVGYVLKNLIPTDKINRFIPLIMAVLGTIINIWINMAVSPEIILGGLASGLASTGAFEMVKHLVNKK